jgi:hypothetical protein
MLAMAPAQRNYDGAKVPAASAIGKLLEFGAQGNRTPNRTVIVILTKVRIHSAQASVTKR